jgi:hypothetical protein
VGVKLITIESGVKAPVKIRFAGFVVFVKNIGISEQFTIVEICEPRVDQF